MFRSQKYIIPCW